MKQQAGFTLIELIAVIVILGILAATALPKFIDMSDAAEQAAADGVAGNIGSAMALNYAGAVADNAGLDMSATPPVAVDNCNDGGSLLLGGLPDPLTWTIADNALVVGTPEECTLTSDAGKTATFQGIATP